MCSTSKKVKISVLSSSGQVQSKKPSLSQICLACIAHEKERLSNKKSKLIDSFHPSKFSLNLHLLDLTQHSCQLLAKSYLEAGGSDPQNLESEFDFLSHSDTFQHVPDEDNEDENEDENEDDDFTEEVIYGFVLISSLCSMLI